MSREERNAVREKRKHLVNELIDALIAKHFAVLNRGIPSSSDVARSIALYEGDLSATDVTATEFYVAVSRLEKYISKKNIELGTSYPLPTVPIRLKRSAQIRNERWNKHCVEAGKVALMLEHYFDNRNIKNLNEADLVCIFSLSLIYHSGIWNPSVLIALLKSLGEAVRLSSLNMQSFTPVWRDVKVESKNIYTDEFEGKKFLWHRCFFDAFSLQLYLHLCSRRDSESIFKSLLTIDELDILNSLRSFFKRHEIKVKLNSLKEICEFGLVYAEKYTNVSPAIQHSAVGKIITAELPFEYWEEMFVRRVQLDQVVSNQVANDFYEMPSSYKNQAPKSRKVSNLRCLNALRAVYSARTNGIKLTNAEAESRLLGLDLTAWSSEMMPLYCWIKSLHASHRNLKVSSIRRYLSEVANDWASTVEGLDIDALSDDDFSTIYRSMLESVSNEERRNYKSRCLEEFHNFNVNHSNFPPIMDDVFSYSATARYVNAGYVSYECYQNVLNVIHASEISAEQKISLQLVVIIAYRAGLRIGEIIKLRLADIEESSIRTIFVVNNHLGNNKSRSARRKIPLKFLMDKKELELFNSWFAKRAREVNGFDHPLFNSKLDLRVPINARTVSAYINTIMRELYPSLELTFHHFRHSCLSNMQWLVEGELETYSALVGVDKAHSKMTFEAILGSEKYTIDRYLALACFAGHSSPETTFRNYLHFSSFILHKKLIDQCSAITIVNCKNRLGVSTKKFNIEFGCNRSSTDLSYKEFYAYVVRPFSALAAPAPEFRSVVVNLGQVSITKVTLFNVHRVLRDFQNGTPLKTLELRYGIPGSKISAWVEVARNIAALKTREGMSRMISSTVATVTGEQLLPSLVFEYAEVRFLNEVVEGLRSKIVKSPEALTPLKEALRYYLRHSLVTNSGIPFQSVDTLKLFIDAFLPVLKHEQWRVAINDTEPLILTSKIIDKSLNNLSSQKVMLFLRHPNELKLVGGSGSCTKYTSQILRFFMHMTAIRVLTTLDLASC